MLQGWTQSFCDAEVKAAFNPCVKRDGRIGQSGRGPINTFGSFARIGLCISGGLLRLCEEGEDRHGRCSRGGDEDGPVTGGGITESILHHYSTEWSRFGNTRRTVGTSAANDSTAYS